MLNFNEITKCGIFLKKKLAEYSDILLRMKILIYRSLHKTYSQ